MQILLSSPPSLRSSSLYTQLVECFTAFSELTHPAPDDWQALPRYDAVVTCVTEEDAQGLARELPERQLIIAPIFKAGVQPSNTWWQQFQTHRFLVFCRSQHEQLLQAGLETAYFQPYTLPKRSPRTGAGAILWERQGSTWASVMLAARQCLALGLSTLHVARMATAQDAAKAKAVDRLAPFTRAGLIIHIKQSDLDRDDLEALFAPYALIVLPQASVSEIPALALAMAMRRIVLAPSSSPASDYVGHGVSGLLYDPRAPLAMLSAVGAACLPDLARAAQTRARRGFGRWAEDAERLLSWLANDGRRWSTTDAAAHFGNQLRLRAGKAAKRR